MTSAALTDRGGTLVAPAGRRGYHVDYRGDGSDRCPGCGRGHFYVGRVSAECAFCGTALPLPAAPNSGQGATWTSTKPHAAPAMRDELDPSWLFFLAVLGIALAVATIIVPGALWLSQGAPSASEAAVTR